MRSPDQLPPIAVVGATGHTGRFVLDELGRRGLRATLVARDPQKLLAEAACRPGCDTRLADVEDPASLDAALADTAAVINCAGPFLDTAMPVVRAALRARIPYLDVTAEQAVVQSIAALDAEVRRAGIVVIPAAAFFGGLADLLASAVLAGEAGVDDISIAVALDRWHPTRGTRLTGARNTVRRVIVRDGVLQPLDDSEPTRTWRFPAPFGARDVVMLPFGETLTLSRHLKANTIESWIDRASLRDVADETTPAPQPVDEWGRSAQQFAMDVAVRAGERHLRATAFGRDIYAVSAPIAVEALQRVLARTPAEIAGVRSLGDIFDARDVLASLGRSAGLRVTYQASASASRTMRSCSTACAPP